MLIPWGRCCLWMWERALNIYGILTFSLFQVLVFAWYQFHILRNLIISEHIKYIKIQWIILISYFLKNVITMDLPLWINVITLLPWLKKLNKRVAPNKWIKQEGPSNYKVDIQPPFMDKEQKMIKPYYSFMFYWGRGGGLYLLKSKVFRKFL